MHRSDSKATKIDVAVERGGVVAEKKDSVHLLGLNLTGTSPSVQLILLSVGVFFFYLMYGYMQELIFRLPGFRPFGWYLTLIQFALYSSFGIVDSKIQRIGERKIPLSTYVQLAFYTVATMGLSNASVGHLNYPTQGITHKLDEQFVKHECCKLIPVLIGGILIQGKRYGWIDVLAALCMSAGLIFFTLADSAVSPNFHAKGYVMISLALVADAVIGNVQEKAMKGYHATNTEVVLYSYAIGCVYIFIGTLITGEMVEGFTFCLDYPLETYGYAVIFSTTGYFGIQIVLTLVKTFGALIAVTVTTCRKAVTIVISFIFFAKPFTTQYIWSGLIVLFGIYLSLYSKNRDRWNAHLVQTVQKIISYFQQIRIRRFQSTRRVQMEQTV